MSFDVGAVRIGLVSGSSSVYVGRWNSGSVNGQQVGGLIDVSDISAFPTNGALVSQAGLIGHEVAEQTRKQLGNLPDVMNEYDVVAMQKRELAHQAGLDAQSAIDGAVRVGLPGVVPGLIVTRFRTSSGITGIVLQHTINGNVLSVREKLYR
ncbi:hypothetical protein GWN42_26385 [candidate division KSB1 bacterium]|nr:hypothetical protein [candidate division KSB1 bacterium]NIU27682.1 hypothetical protein [candidate division KSB1 bacterium]NIU93513.1 hypothetical protein [candidate division KSB1 bacterium]NIV96219.1 hypothetical protein [candidate division KSB1 bacterium]NIW21621.1 hypothetical protein [candidate division KSB1 bacterium]